MDSDVGLGQIFTPGQAEDLAFRFRVVGGGFINGIVDYVTGGGIVGDYNGDGVVNLADYTVWRDNLGGVSLPNEDPSQSPGVVDSADYLVWKNSFGASAVSLMGSVSSTSTIPEPASMLLAVGLLIGLLPRKQQR